MAVCNGNFGNNRTNIFLKLKQVGNFMGTPRNSKFCSSVQGARNAETEIVRRCTAKLRVPRNEAMNTEGEFIQVRTWR